MSDTLLDLDAALTVKIYGTQAFSGIVPRTVEAIDRGLARRPDRVACPTAVLALGETL